jgi:hypothetical protein
VAGGWDWFPKRRVHLTSESSQGLLFSRPGFRWAAPDLARIILHVLLAPSYFVLAGFKSFNLSLAVSISTGYCPTPLHAVSRRMYGRLWGLGEELDGPSSKMGVVHGENSNASGRVGRSSWAKWSCLLLDPNNHFSLPERHIRENNH